MVYETIEFTEEEALAFFPGARKSKRSGKLYLEGYIAIYRKLGRLFRDSFKKNDGSKMILHSGTNYLYRLMNRDEEGSIQSGKPEEYDLKIPCMVLILRDEKPPVLGEDNEGNWFRHGEFDNGKPRMIRFIMTAMADLVFDVYVVRNNILDCIDDKEIWRYLWKEHQFLRIGNRKDDDGNVISSGGYYRTRMDDSMAIVSAEGFVDYHFAKGSIEIQGVRIVDPTKVEVTGVIEDEEKFAITVKKKVIL